MLNVEFHRLSLFSESKRSKQTIVDITDDSHFKWLQNDGFFFFYSIPFYSQRSLLMWMWLNGRNFPTEKRTRMNEICWEKMQCIRRKRNWALTENRIEMVKTNVRGELGAKMRIVKLKILLLWFFRFPGFPIWCRRWFASTDSLWLLPLSVANAKSFLVVRFCSCMGWHWIG